MDNVNYYVYFDGKQLGGSAGTACAVYTDIKSPKPIASKTVNVANSDGNQFNIVLRSLLTAIDCIKENELRGTLALMHQNNTVMNWLLAGKCNDNYEAVFSEVLQELSTLQFDCNIFLKQIPPNENKAKKIVSKLKAPKEASAGMTKLVLNNPYINTTLHNSNPNLQDFGNAKDTGSTIIQFKNVINR